MSTARTILLAMAAMGAAACQTTQTGGGPAGGGPARLVNADCPLPKPSFVEPSRKCEHANCPLWVQVVTNPVTGVCEVIVEASELRMAPQYQGPDNSGVTLNWWIPRSPDIPWEFRQEAGLFTVPVEFKDQSAPGLRDQFSAAAVSRDKSQVDVGNKNGNRQTYNYRIKVYKKGTDTSITSPDPSIINDF